jgi:hypothetical protein
VKKFLLSKGYKYEIINDIINDISREWFDFLTYLQDNLSV